MERFHRTFKSEHVRQSACLGRADAVERMKKWIRYYNGERLHSALYYLPPDDVFYGRMEIRLVECRKKLHAASINRKAIGGRWPQGFEPPYMLAQKTASSAQAVQ
jgi:hypothetical protein